MIPKRVRGRCQLAGAALVILVASLMAPATADTGPGAAALAQPASPQLAATPTQTDSKQASAASGVAVTPQALGQPRIPASQRTTSPLLRKEWPPRSPFIRITESELLDVIQPRYNQRNKAILTCLAANGTVRTTLTPNSDLNLQNGYRVETLGPFGEAAPGARRNLTFLYYPVEPLPTNGRVFAFFFIQNECTVPGVTEPARPVRSRATLVVTKDACWGCLENCVRGNGFTPTTCDVWDSYCPVSWPTTIPNGVAWSVSAYFSPENNSSCSNVAINATNIYRLMDQFVKDQFVAGGRDVVNLFGATAPTTILLAGKTPICRDASSLGTPYGVVQVLLDINPEKNVAGLLSQMVTNWHRRNICSAIIINTPLAQKARVVADAFCNSVGAPGPRLQWAGICVQKANPKRKYKDGFPVEAACFPGDAMVTLMDPVTGAPTRLVTMGELAIGDVIECLKPAGFESRVTVDYRDSAQTYVRGACHVFNYHDADADTREPFMALHYTDASGRPAKLRATATHLVHLAASELPLSAAATQLPPGGFARRADMVAVGDLLVVKSARLGSNGGPVFYSALVSEITIEEHMGAFAPILSDAGLPIVDRAVAYSWSHLPPYDPHPMQNIGEYMRHVRLFTDYFESVQSGCEGLDCPCLDSPADAGVPCVRLGDRLADVPKGKSDFAQRTIDVWSAAHAQGRTFWDYEAGISLARLWESSPLIQWLEKKVFRARPHTVGILATSWHMARPQRADGYGGAEYSGSGANVAMGVAAAQPALMLGPGDDAVGVSAS